MATSVGKLTYSYKDQNLELDPSSATAEVESYKCGICFGFMNKPVKVCECQHRYCQECIEKWKRKSNACPVDRTPLLANLTVVDNEFIAGLRFFCPHNDCVQKLPIADIPSHMENCLEEIINCPGQCGTAPFKRKKLIEHAENCSSHFQCECGEFFPESHEQKLFKKYMDHIKQQPGQHKTVRQVQYMLEGQRGIASETVFKPPLLGPDKSKVHTLLGIPCAETPSRYIFQSLENQRDFIFLYPWGLDELETGKIPLSELSRVDHVEKKLFFSAYKTRDGYELWISSEEDEELYFLNDLPVVSIYSGEPSAFQTQCCSKKHFCGDGVRGWYIAKLEGSFSPDAKGNVLFKISI